MDKEKRSKIGANVTGVGLIVNILLTGLKIVVGFIFSSMALIADGIHSLSDLVSDIFVMVTIWVSKKPADDKHNYGHGRVEIIGEVAVSLMLIVAAYVMTKNGLIKIRDFSISPISKPSLYTLLVALVSIISKEALYWYTKHYAKKINSQSMYANAVHHRSDALSSIAVLAALGLALYKGPTWYILDPIVALCVAIYLFFIAVKILIESFSVLIDSSISDKDYEKVLSILNSIPNTSDPHHVRTRNMGSYIGIEFHIRVNPDMTVRDSHKIACDIENKMRQEFGEDTFVSVHIEPEKVNGEYK